MGEFWFFVALALSVAVGWLLSELYFARNRERYAMGRHMQIIEEMSEYLALLDEAASCLACYARGIRIDEATRPDALDLCRRCMEALGHDDDEIDARIGAR